MTRLRDIMTRDVVTVPPDLTIRDAMSLFSSRHISGAPVVAGREIIGVVTSTDLMAFAAELPGAPTRRNEPAEIDDATDRQERFPGVEAEPQGSFFTELWDDAGADVTVRFADTNAAEWNVLDEHTVEEAMTRAPIRSMPGDTLLAVAAEFMRTHAIHRILVEEEEKLIGIATATDIVNAVAGHKLREPAFVFGKESHFTGQPGGKPSHPETALGARLPRPPGGKAE
jgi:CBS domain-containing protein